METINLSYRKEERGRNKMLLALLISLLFHALLIFLLQFGDILIIDLGGDTEKIPEEVTVIFPENKPKQIVENLNENEEIPTKSDLLSDKNSRARNEKILENISDQPATDGNVPIPNLSRPYSAPAFTQNRPVKKFSRESLTGERVSYSSAEEVAAEQQSQANDGTNNVFKQEEFSADELGNISLSTYQWAWAPYINEFKRKLFRVWYAPPAYYQLGLIYGYTVIRFTIDRNGNILDKQILKHEGHSSLEQSSSNAIDAVFPLKPLPAHFPDETLTLTIQMIYPNLRSGSN